MADDTRPTTATVVFTDMVGSSPLRARLGEERADELRRIHDALLSARVRANGGRVIKGQGDGLVAAFSAASDGLTAAVEMQQAVWAYNRRRDALAEISIRIGVSTGDVSWEAGDCFGTPMVEAARLEAAATPGQILCSEYVRMMARGRGGHGFRQLGPLDLKGLSEPLPTSEVAWLPIPTLPAPLPSLLTGTGGIFVGREEPLERLRQLWDEASAGRLRVALVGGEPGVGKTRLAAEFAAGVHAQGATVLAGRCGEDLGVPYQPFVEALRHALDHTPSVDLPGRLGRYGGELGRLVPELLDAVPELSPPLSSDPETERFRLFDAVASWLGAGSAEQPVLLVLDDLQWAAKPTLLLLRHVVRSAESARLLVVGTYRDSDLERGHPLTAVLADLRRTAGVERLSLAGLDRQGVADYMTQAAGQDPDDNDPDLARAIHGETEGNPLFVAEVLRHLIETGALHEQNGRWATARPIDELGIPEGIREVVGRRLTRLSDGANRALTAAAVLGLEFEFAVLEVVAGLEEEPLLSALDEAALARLLVEVPGAAPRYRFAHALVRGTLYDEVSAARRVTAHRRVGEAIERVHAGRIHEHLPALAHHFTRGSGSAVEALKAVDYTRRAGEGASAQLAHDEAASYYRQTLELLDSARAPEESAERLQLLLALGEASAHAGDDRTSAAFLCAARLARVRADAESLARAALGLADVWAWTGSVESVRIDLLEEALVALGEADSPLRAHVLGRLATELYFAPGSFRRRDALSAESVTVARRIGDPLALASCLHARSYAIWGPGGAEERLAAGREIVHFAERAGSPELALHGHTWCQIALLELGDVVGLDAELAAYERLAEDLRRPRYRWYAHARRAMRALLAGDLDAGERLAIEAFAMGKRWGEPDAVNVHWGLMSVVWQERPSPEAAEWGRTMCRTVDAGQGRESPLALCHHAISTALAMTEGREEAVRAELDHLGHYGVARVPKSFLWAVTLLNVTPAVAGFGHRDEIVSLYNALSPYAGTNAQNSGAVTFLGSYSHHLGVLATALGRWDEAERHFADAAAMHEEMGAHVWLARTRLEWATMLAARRRPEDAERARQHVDDSLDDARRLRLPVVERGAVALRSGDGTGD